MQRLTFPLDNGFVRWFIICVVLAACTPQTIPTLEPKSTPMVNTIQEPIFTYAAADGSVWVIDGIGSRRQVMPPDGVSKWELLWSPNHRWLGYTAWEYPPPDERLIVSLFVVGREGKNIKKLVGPAGGVQIKKWEDENHVSAIVFDRTTSRDLPPEKIPLITTTIDVETNQITYLKVIQPESRLSHPSSQRPPEELSKSPDGQWTVDNKIKDSIQEFYLYDSEKKPVALIYAQPAELDVNFLSWSPDSKWLLYRKAAYLDFTGDLYIYNVQTRTSRQLTNFYRQGDFPPPIYYIRWSPNSRWLFFHPGVNPDYVNGMQNPFCVAEIELNTFKCIDAKPTGDQFIWTRDGRGVAFLGKVGGTRDLYLFDFESGEERNLTNDGDAVIEERFALY